MSDSTAPAAPPGSLPADPNIGYRARKILHAIVSEYLATGDAVGSRTVTRRHGIDLSPATIRNVMSDLEDLGLLHQPHQSAGRVPTDFGLRVFVDSLLNVRSLSAKEKDEIRARFGKPEDFDAAMRETSRILSDLSQQASIVVMPRLEESVCQHLELVRLREGELLAVLVTKEGRIENKLVSIDFPLTPSDLERIHNYLDGLVAGRTLEEVRARILEEVGGEQSQIDALAAKALALAAQAIPRAGEGASALPSVLVEGQANLLDSLGAEDLARVRALFRALDEKRMALQLLERTLDADGIRVFIGAENAASELADCSVIATPIGAGREGERPLGAVAVIGPRRMNYSKIIPIVDFTAELVNGVLLRR